MRARDGAGGPREPLPSPSAQARVVLALRYLLFHTKVDDEDVVGSAWERWRGASRMRGGR